MANFSDSKSPIPPRPPTWNQDGSRIWLYPDRRQGHYAKKRLNWAIALLAIYVVTPFLSWNSRPLLRFDINDRIIYTFGQVFQFNDGPYILFIFLSLALSFFLVTALKGRFWCSYACPQTVFLEWLIRPIEELIEGKATKRRKSAQRAKNLSIYLRKSLKFTVFLLLASAISHIFLLYFIDPSILFAWLMDSPTEHRGPFLAATIMTGIMFFDFAYFREQFCSVLCPYMRFQTVLMDENTPVIAYDSKRGEPRAEGGDCIDCDLCIKVCPTGIDIRNGLQLECIQCGRCADACDSIMRKTEKPLGLVRTASMRDISGTPSKKMRLRPVIYGAALTVVVISLIATLAARDQVSMTFLRQTGAPFTLQSDGRVTNSFQLRLQNNTAEEKEFTLKANSDRVELICGGCQETLRPFEQRLASLIIKVPADYQPTTLQVTNTVSETSYDLPIILPGHSKEAQP